MDVTNDQILVFRAFMFRYQYRLGVMSRTMKIRVWKDTCKEKGLDGTPIHPNILTSGRAIQ